MAHKFRTAAALLILVGGFIASAQIDSGRAETDPPLATYSATEPATFEVLLRRGTLYLSGNTVSAKHEEQLQNSAAKLFPGATLSTAFRPMVIAPTWWSQATLDLLASLSTVRAPGAMLQEEHLSIRGFAVHESVTELELQALRELLPDSVAIDLQLETVAESASAQALCARHFSNLKPGPINFEDTGTVLRASAYPVLGRIVALADACRDSTVIVTGHTDSTGDENWNQQLSLERARAVANYLASMGIELDRIDVAGAGSSFPVASNANDYGRSQNRRIDIQLTAGRPDL